MITLFIDTAQERGLIALGNEKIVLAEANLTFGLHNSQTLYRELDALLKMAQITPKELELIACGVGPGSYTGIRVAAASAKALSFALQLPLVGISTLFGFIPESDGSFVAMLDARISGVYLQKGAKKQSHITYQSEPKAVTLDQLADELQDTQIIVTPKIEPLRTKIEVALREEIRWEEKGLSAKQLIKLALEKHATKDFSLDGSLDLLYLRKTQAEIERGD